MKLRNKKTGEIGYLRSINWDEIALIIMDKNGVQLAKYSSLAELNEDWEDYEEPKAYYIERCGTIEEFDPTKDVALTEMLKEIGNYFETKEEAEKVVEKLKAWKRLKDKGFRFTGWNWMMTGRGIEYEAGEYYAKWVDDMNLIFEDEE